MSEHETMAWFVWGLCVVLGMALIYFDDVDPNDGGDPEE